MKECFLKVEDKDIYNCTVHEPLFWKKSERDVFVVDWSPCATKMSTSPCEHTAIVHFHIKGNLPLTFCDTLCIPFNKCTSSFRVTPRSRQ